MNAPADLPILLNPRTGHPLVDVGLLERGTYLGGADAAAIMGLHPYRTPLDVFRAKVDPLSVDHTPDPKKEKLLRRGKYWEPVVAQMLREDFGIEIVRQNARMVDPEFPYFAAEIDFEWHDADPTIRNGEIKSVHPLAAGKYGQMETDEVPIEHAAQSMWGLMITGRDLCQYGVVFGADDLTIYHVRRDEETIANMRAAAWHFWNEHVLAKVPPAPKTFEDMMYLWPKDRGTSIEATPEIAALLKSHEILSGRASAVKEGREALELEIAEFVKQHSTITLGGQEIATYKEQTTTTLDSARLKAELRAIHAEYTRESHFRVLRHKKGK